MHVVEVLAHDSFAAQNAIADVPGVVSVTQLGIRLRILIPEAVTDPLERVRQRLASRGLEAETELSSAGLEDVFVAVTMKPEAKAA